MAALWCLFCLLFGSIFSQSTHRIPWINSNASIPIPLHNAISLYFSDHFIIFGGNENVRIYIGTTQEVPVTTTFIKPPSSNNSNAPSVSPSAAPTTSNEYQYSTQIVNWTAKHSIYSPMDGTNKWSIGTFECQSQCYSPINYISWATTASFFIKGWGPNCNQDFFLYEFHPWQLIYGDTLSFARHNLTRFYFNATHKDLYECSYSIQSHACVATNPRTFEQTHTVYIILGNRIFVYNVTSETGYFSDTFTAQIWRCFKIDNSTEECQHQVSPFIIDQCAASFDSTDKYLWITDNVGNLWRYDVDQDAIIDVATYAYNRTFAKTNINGTLASDDGQPYYYYEWDTYKPSMIQLSHGFIMITGENRDFILLPNTSNADSNSYPSSKTKYIDVVCAGTSHYSMFDWIAANKPVFLSWPSLNVLSLGGYIFSDIHYKEYHCEKEYDESYCSEDQSSYYKIAYNQTLSTEIRTYSWLQDYHLIINFTEKILFGDSIVFNVYYEPTCNLYEYSEYLHRWIATRFNPFVIEVQIDADDENIGIDTNYMYVLNATEIEGRKDWITTYSQCYLCLERQPLNFTDINYENEEELLPDECSFCVDGLSTGDIEEDQAGERYQLGFKILNAPKYGMFTLESSARDFIIAECDPGYGTTEGAQSLDCNRCPFNQFTLQQALEPCIACNTVSEGLLCEGGNETHLTYNYWVAAWDEDDKELKPLYDIERTDVIVSALCPPKYCCQSVSGCDYLSEYLKRPKESNDTDELWNIQYYDSGYELNYSNEVDIESNGLLCAFGRDVNVPLCGACLEGYAELLGTTQCGECHGAWWLIIVNGFIFAMLLSWYIIFYDSKPVDFKLFKNKKEIMIADDITGFQTLLFKPILYYFQSILPILDTRGIKLWISPVVALFNFSFDTISGSDYNICWSSNLDACGEILVNVLLPALLMINLILPRFCINKEGYGSKPCCCCCKGKKICCCCCRNYQTPYFASAFFRVLLITIGVVLTVCFKYLTFVVIEDKKLLFYSADKEAFNGWWFGGFFGVLFVVISFIIIYRQIKKQEAAQRYSTNSIYRKFVKSYKEEFWFWEFILFSRRFFVSCFTSIQFVGGGYTNFIFLAILLIYLMLNIQYKPFAYSRVNKIETLCVMLLTLAFAAANFIHIDDNDAFVGWILSLCILIPLVILLFYFLKIVAHLLKWTSYDPHDRTITQNIAKILYRMPKSFRDVTTARGRVGSGSTGGTLVNLPDNLLQLGVNDDASNAGTNENENAKQMNATQTDDVNEDADTKENEANTETNEETKQMDTTQTDN